MKHMKTAIFISLLLVVLLVMPFSARAVTQAEIDKLQEERNELAEKEQESSGFCDATVFSDSEAAAVKELSDLIDRETV